MKERQKDGQISANQVFLFSEKVRNDGQIISTGPNAKTRIETKEYEGKGSIESHNEYPRKENWIRKHILQIIVGVTVGLILFYIFGIGK